MSGVFYFPIQNRRSEKQGFPQGPDDFLDRKDKQALAIRVLLAQAACLFADWKNKQANTTGAHNTAMGPGTGRLSEKTSKRLFNDL